MQQYKVELISIDRKDEISDVHFSTFVEADNSDEAIRNAKIVQKQEIPGINTADTWMWFAYETAEKQL